jgi:hypothetical protein
VDDPIDRYREYAEECLRLAETASTPEFKDFLLKMAQAWHWVIEREAAMSEGG